MNGRDQIRSILLDLAELAESVVEADGYWGNSEVRRHQVEKADALVSVAREVLDRYLPGETCKAAPRQDSHSYFEEAQRRG
jgi:hypothetical protein